MKMRTILTSCAILALATAARAEVSDATVKAIGAPDAIETSLGTLNFKDGVPTSETAAKVYDLSLIHI